MSYSEVVFGTDGWRAKLGEGFTTDRFAAVIAALCETKELKRAQKQQQPVLVAYDARFQADAFARLAAAILHRAGHTVVVSDAPAGTPGICAAIVDRSAAIGVMITASHNPPEYLGIKIKGSYGGSATPKFTRQLVNKLQQQKRHPRKEIVALPDMVNEHIEVADINAEHMSRLHRFMTPSAGQDTIVHDAMFGSGRNLMRSALNGTKAKTVAIRHAVNPGFGGIGPEPVEDRLEPMFQATRRRKASMGIATDGDADRVAACDAQGNFIFPHEIFALMTAFLVDRMGQTGSVVRNVATSELVRKVAEDRGLDVTTTPVGFKHIVDVMLKGGVLIGGEESGGIAVPAYLPERDGIMCGLMLREIVLQNRKPIRQQLNALYRKYGRSVYRRWDLHIPETKKDKILRKLKRKPPEHIGHAKVERIETTDGFKFWLGDDHWLLVRASGTEPILRVYIEHRNLREVERVYRAFSDWTAAI